ncbi:MAG: cupredoxin family protein [Proteobacteria bacterium]|nr:cupredoxin family protein [Pseudomonadota bacterium]
MLKKHSSALTSVLVAVSACAMIFTSSVSGAEKGDSTRHISHADIHHKTDTDKNSVSKPGAAERIVTITALDIRYDLPALKVKTGETVRFVVTNKGNSMHEFVLGDAAEQAEHEKMMQGMRGMIMADEANAIRLKPGETKELVWTFAKAGTLEYACHQPGHYAAGMVGKIVAY